MTVNGFAIEWRWHGLVLLALLGFFVATARPSGVAAQAQATGVLGEGVTGLPTDITPLLSLAGIWQPVADGDITPQNHGQAVDFAGNLRLHNGREGLVFAGWSFAGFSNTDGRIIPVSIAFLEQQGDGTLQLATSKYVADPSTNGAGSVVIADFNRDGVDDVFLAAWNEAPNIPASSTAFLSTGSGYQRISVQDFVEAHGANVADINGTPTVFTAGYYAVPGRSNTIAYFNGVNDFTVVPDLGISGNSSVAVADFYGTGTYSAVYGDVTGGPGIFYDPTKGRGIYLYNVRDSHLAGTPVNVGAPYFDGKPQYAQYPSFWDPQKTHTYRIWTDDLNQDTQVDVVAQAQIWSAATGPEKNVVQLFLNEGNYAFQDVTDALNPEWDENCYQHEYQPQLRDVDGSGIKSYFFASMSFNRTQVPCNYVLVNDGTGRLRVALHETLNSYAQQILNWLPGRLPSGNFVQWPPLLRAYRTPNGRLNFVAMAQVATQRGPDFVTRFVFVNLPLQLDLARQFTKPIVIQSQNGSRRIRTFAGDDTIYASGAGGASIDGGDGFNTVVYPKMRSSYAIARGDNGSWHVSTDGARSADTLTRIQQVRFAGDESR
jgi:hypothetical protein